MINEPTPLSSTPENLSFLKRAALFLDKAMQAESRASLMDIIQEEVSDSLGFSTTAFFTKKNNNHRNNCDKYIITEYRSKNKLHNANLEIICELSPSEDKWVKAIFDSDHAIYIPDAANDPRPNQDIVKEMKIHSMISRRMTKNGVIIGAISAANYTYDKRAALTESEVDYYNFLCCVAEKTLDEIDTKKEIEHYKNMLNLIFTCLLKNRSSLQLLGALAHTDDMGSLKSYITDKVESSLASILQLKTLTDKKQPKPSKVKAILGVGCINNIECLKALLNNEDIELKSLESYRGVVGDDAVIIVDLDSLMNDLESIGDYLAKYENSYIIGLAPQRNSNIVCDQLLEKLNWIVRQPVNVTELIHLANNKPCVSSLITQFDYNAYQ